MTNVSTENRLAVSVRPNLTFSDRGEAAVNFYVSTFENSKVVNVVRSDGSGLIPAGKLMHAAFVLDGQEYTAFDGGASFEFSEGFSMVATCQTQEELDQLWSKLSEGGEEGRCGWLKDRFGVSWQVVPAALGDMMGNPQGGNAGTMMEALLKMNKLDIATLKRAYESGS